MKPVKVDEEAQRQFAALGVHVEIEVMEDDVMPIGRDIWDSVKAFLACETQWRVVSTMSQLIWIGLDYAGAKVMLDFQELATPKIFRDLQVMEAAALPLLNKGD